MRASSLIIFGVFIACAFAIFMNPYPKVVNSPKPEQKVIAEHSVPNTTNCNFATSQGRRHYQEDRVTCDLHLNILFLGHDGGLEEVKVGVVAVFDGHIGDHASDMASRIFLDKFQLKNLGEQTSNSMESLKSSLVKTIEDIDTEFSKAAVEHELYSGSTAVVALIYNNHVLVAHVGDSKALLCSRNMQSHESGKGAASLAGLLAKELTRDHNALRLDEKARVEASGGIFTPNFVPLLMGHFPMTRAIGDVPLKRYGIIATPEVTDWLHLTSKDEFLVVASDGIFESLSTQNVCDFLDEVENHSDPSLLAQQLIRKAFSEGSRDNLSVVLVPLR